MGHVVDRIQAALADRYVIEGEIGQGGMGTILLAYDRHHDRRVAVKVLRPELMATAGAVRFQREIKTAAQLNHPNILTVIDSGEAIGLSYYVMPYVEGESLRQRLDREGPLPVEQAIAVAREIADALAYAHERGVVHRDVKPANILCAEGHAYIVDFGVAQALATFGDERLTSTGTVVGSAQYMSPEQANADKPIDERSDVYSLGCVLYEMLAGEPPFLGHTSEIILLRRLTESPTPLPLLRDTVPGALDTVVMKALSRTPADRFSSARDFAAALDVERLVGVEAQRSDLGELVTAQHIPRRRLLRGRAVRVAVGYPLVAFVVVEGLASYAVFSNAVLRVLLVVFLVGYPVAVLLTAYSDSTVVGFRDFLRSLVTR